MDNLLSTILINYLSKTNIHGLSSASLQPVSGISYLIHLRCVYIMIAIFVLTYSHVYSSDTSLTPREINNIVSAYAFQERQNLSSAFCEIQEGITAKYIFNIQGERVFLSYSNELTKVYSETIFNDSSFMKVVVNTDNMFVESYNDINQIRYQGLPLKVMPNIPFLGIVPDISNEFRFRLLSELLKNGEFTGRTINIHDDNQEIVLQGRIHKTIYLSLSLTKEHETQYVINHIVLKNENTKPGNYYFWEYIADDYITDKSQIYPSKYHINLKTKPGIENDKHNDLQILTPQAFTEVSTTLNYDVVLNNTASSIPVKFSRSIPNGTPVYMRDAPQIEYIWMDGKIVPKTDERMLAIARGGHKFMPGPKESRFWLILLGIVGILVGGGWKLYDFWTSDREPTSPQPKDQAG